MSTIIQIKRNSSTTAPSTSDLIIGEMAYAYDASNNGASGKLYIEATNSSSAADIHIIGGKYYTDLLDHTKGTLTASSALLVDSNSKLDVINIDNLRLDANTLSSINSNGDININPDGTGNVVVGSDTLSVMGAEGESASLVLIADESDDASDEWTVTANTGGTLTFGNDIASAGTPVAHLTISPHATVTNSTILTAGHLIVCGTLGVTGVVTANAGVVVDTITIDAGQIDQSSGDLTLDVAGDIILDADGGDIVFRDDGGTFFQVTNSSSDVILRSVAADKDIYIQGFDGSNLITALTLDMSDAGSAAFNNNVSVAGNLTVSGTTTTVSSTVTTIADPLIELATGTTGTPSNDAGHVIERGDSDNIFIGWDESDDVFTAATGSFTGASTGNLSITPAAAKFGSLTLTTDLAVAEGGTGVSSFTDKGIVYGDGSSALDVTAAPGGSDVTASFQILTCGSSNGNPVWTTTIDGGTY